MLFLKKKGTKKEKAVIAYSVPELPDDADGQMAVEDCIMGSASGVSMSFEFSDKVSPVSEMRPVYQGGRDHFGPAKLNLGHGYWLGPAMGKIGSSEKGSVGYSLATEGQVALHGPRGFSCILKKKVNLFQLGRPPLWHIYDTDENLSAWRKRASISYDQAISAFVYRDQGAIRWIGKGNCSRLEACCSFYTKDCDGWLRASIGSITVHDAATNSIVAVFSGACNGPKIIRLAKHADVAALLSFALIACFWWDDSKIGDLHIIGLP